MAFLSGWLYRKKITIDYTKIASDLTDFPVLVKLTSSNFNFSKARSDGYDIRFTSSDGITLLKYERERHDSANSVAEYWVKIPLVSSTADTIFYIYYGNPSASDGADPTSVWDANYVFVSHMKNDPDSTHVKDSTSYANNGAKVTATEPAEADGAIAEGQSFDGSNDAITVPNASQLDITTGGVTLEAWIKLNSVASSMWIAAKGYEETNQNNYCFFTHPPQIEFRTVGTAGRSHYGSTSLTTGTWYRVAATCAVDAASPALYVNTNIDTLTIDDSSSSTYQFVANANPLYVACYQTENFLNGLIDELRISKIVRSASWIQASYYSESNSLLTLGSEEIGWIPRVIIF